MTTAHRVRVSDRRAPDGNVADYVDCFEIEADPRDDRTAEQWLRSSTRHVPSLGPRAVVLIHDRVLGFDLDLTPAPDRLFGWSVVTSEPDAVHLTATGPTMTGHLLATRQEGRVRLTTYVAHHRRTSPPIWTAIGPLHRLIAPRLLEHAAGQARYSGLAKSKR